MERPSHRARYLKILLLAGILTLLSTATMAQQEVSPDIYGDAAPAVQKAKPAKPARKPSKTLPKFKTESRSAKEPRKLAAERKLAASIRHKPVPAPVQ